jgi:DNA-directed RNA polymerase specialized sigma24 family protein
VLKPVKVRQTERPTYELMLDDKVDGISVLYERYGRKLFGYGKYTWNVDEDDNWSIVYQTLFKVYEKIREYEFDSERSFAGIVYKIYLNYLRKHHRKTMHREQFLQFTCYNELNFEEAGEDRLMGAEREVRNRIVKSHAALDEEPAPESPAMIFLKEELEKLESWQRMLLELKSQNMPYKEIARYIDKPAGQLKVYYQRLRNRLLKSVNDKLMAVKNN